VARGYCGSVAFLRRPKGACCAGRILAIWNPENLPTSAPPGPLLVGALTGPHGWRRVSPGWPQSGYLSGTRGRGMAPLLGRSRDGTSGDSGDGGGWGGEGPGEDH